jgi:hypothetical protein
VVGSYRHAYELLFGVVAAVLLAQVRWAAAAMSNTAPAFSATAAPGMFLVFQLGLWAYDTGVWNVTAAADDLAGPCPVRGVDVVVFNLGAWRASPALHASCIVIGAVIISRLVCH